MVPAFALGVAGKYEIADEGFGPRPVRPRTRHRPRGHGHRPKALADLLLANLNVVG
jgi:hypothetical protein